MKPKGLYVSPTQYVSFAEPKQRLSDHIATRDRSPDFSALGLYLPNPDPILKKQGRDISVYNDLRSDAHVGGCIRRRKAAVQALEWRIEREGASARSAKLAEDVLKRLDMRRLLHELMDAVLFGWQPLEVIWSPPGAGPIVPQEVLAKPVQWFHFDSDAQLRFKSREHPLYGEELAARKFLVPAQEASYANPYGFADLSMCFWPTVFKRGGLKFWVTFTEKFGTPWVVGKTPRGTPGPEQNKLLDQLEAMVQDAVAVVPDDASVEIIEAGGKGTSADLYERLLMFCRSEIAIALLGQNQSTEASANRASATAGLEVAKDLRDGDARLCEATINQLLRWVVDSNDGVGAPAPKFELFEQEEVNEVQARRDKLLTEAGVTFTPAYWQRVYGLEAGDMAPPAAPAVATAVTASSTAAESGAAATAKAAAQAPTFAETTAPESDEIDVLVDAELAQWRPLLEPLAAPLQAAMDEAAANGETAAQLIARLPQLLAQMDADALAQALTRTAFTARLAGAAALDDATPGDAGTASAARQAMPAPAFAEPTPDPRLDQISASMAALQSSVDLLAAKEPLVIHNNIQLPEQSAPVVNNTVHLPEQAAPVVNLAAPAITVQPAPVTVNNAFASKAVQTVERDANDEIVRTVTTYQ